MKHTEFESRDALNSAFAQKIASLLSEDVEQHGQASLLVSGGRTPIDLFKALSHTPLAWDKVTISLADERWVSIEDDASNEKLVRTHLLQAHAKAATFVSLTTRDTDAEQGIAEVEQRVNQIKQPFTVVILGMGEDGHTASLFPCSAQLADGLNMQSGHKLIAVTPTTAPHQRISFTLPALVNSQHVFLHLTGDSKKDVLEKALAGNDEHEMPIRAVLSRCDVELMWAP